MLLAVRGRSELLSPPRQKVGRAAAEAWLRERLADGPAAQDRCATTGNRQLAYGEQVARVWVLWDVVRSALARGTTRKRPGHQPIRANHHTDGGRLDAKQTITETVASHQTPSVYVLMVSLQMLTLSPQKSKTT